MRKWCVVFLFQGEWEDLWPSLASINKNRIIHLDKLDKDYSGHNLISYAKDIKLNSKNASFYYDIVRNGPAYRILLIFDKHNNIISHSKMLVLE